MREADYCSVSQSLWEFEAKQLFLWQVNGDQKWSSAGNVFISLHVCRAKLHVNFHGTWNVHVFTQFIFAVTRLRCSHSGPLTNSLSRGIVSGFSGVEITWSILKHLETMDLSENKITPNSSWFSHNLPLPNACFMLVFPHFQTSPSGSWQWLLRQPGEEAPDMTSPDFPEYGSRRWEYGEVVPVASCFSWGELN